MACSKVLRNNVDITKNFQNCTNPLKNIFMSSSLKLKTFYVGIKLPN